MSFQYRLKSIGHYFSYVVCFTKCAITLCYFSYNSAFVQIEIMEDHSYFDNCTCETGTVTINASLVGDDPDVISVISCPISNKCCDGLLSSLGFWLEGVVQVTFAILGILSNLVSCMILASKDMRNAFNLLLIALALFDCGYLFGSILESFRKSFDLVGAK